MDMRKYFAWTLVAALALTAGCGSSDDDDLGGKSGGGSSAPAGQMGTASISGKVTLKGKVTASAKISMDADPVCRSQHATAVSDETVVADAKGDLANVFVYVKEGAGSYPAPATPVLLDQKGCMYHPHVFGIQVGQALQIQNSDPTLHNVHAMPTVNDGFNVGQPSQNMKSEKKFAKAEVMVKFKCDVHSWMHCFVGVLNHPFFNVTGTDGAYKISQLPAGSYTLVAWQEKYGESQPVKVDIKDGEAKTADFTFTAQ